MKDLDLLIGGTDTLAEGGRRYERLNPVSGTPATRAAAASVADARAAVAAAQGALAAWSATGPEARRAVLLRAGDIMEARAADFVAAMTEETGATKVWAGFNVHLAAGMLREAGAMTSQIGGEVIPSNKPGTLAMAVARPRGVCLGIAPWNAPVILGTRAVAMALACGNTVVLKASEMCPRTHRLIGECLVEAGLPAGAINVISNAPEDAAEVVRTLIEAPEVRHVNFTGSTGVGRIIGRLAGENLKPALLELGGKAPFLVLEDADIDGAVNAAIFGSFMNQGQICMSTERIIVVEAVADAFVERLAARAAALPWGDPAQGDVVLGALVSPEAGAKMAALIADATAKGARLVAGGSGTGALHSATLLDGVTPQMRIYAEESFGPVKSVIRVADTEAAIRVANDTEYGLSSAVFSQDITRALAVANRLESGICHVNGPTVSDEPQMPFGGVKASGYGRFGGKAGIAEFTQLRWITLEDPKQAYPF
ncbi:aldehyde dehydrogenase [Pseudooceanicola sp. CBS1P-1]|uniref:Aldehyde dehydrogenase family protein n=1 Tax=Pseudooceanicola albus TaxID=2692189 RepID=A0A6L7G6J2_9RHOB|nr:MULTISPECIES: aldehyde dehydrogenase [Pseudooceanicola]MBT9386030.1 aldehyde dehydrogenase [Pseudooceanicola endophyticus]MXN19549.1 aldehyde dehydrogenase family protein [Pseudooceanicola albus]